MNRTHPLFLFLARIPRLHEKTRELVWNIIAIGVPLLVYLRTMAPTVYGLDSAELTTGAYSLGIVHSPGSPLFMLLGHLFTRLPWGDVGYRVNLLAACAAALSVFFLYRLVWRLTHERAIAISTSWFFAFTYYFWTSALAAELYSLLACFTALCLLLAVRWLEDGRPQYLFLLSLVFGLGLGNHLSLALIGPGLVWIVLSRPGRWKSPKLITSCLALGCLGVAVYLYLPLRYSSDAALNYARDYWMVDLSTLDGFWWMVSGQMFSSLYWAYDLSQIPAEIGRYLYQLWSNFLGFGLFLGIIGLLGDFKRRPKFHAGLVIMWITYLLFYIPYGARDKQVMFLPSYLIWSIWVGVGIWVLKNHLAQRVSVSAAKAAAYSLFVLALGSLLFNYSYVDVSQDRSARLVGEKILDTLEQDALYFGSWIDVPILEYLQIVEGERNDVTTRNLYFMSPNASRKMAQRRLADGYSVYTSLKTRFDPSTFQRLPLSACDCYQLKLRSDLE